MVQILPLIFHIFGAVNSGLAVPLSASVVVLVMSQGVTHIKRGTEWISQAHGARIWEETLLLHCINLWLPKTRAEVGNLFSVAW